MRQILSKGQLVVCWALGLWCSFLLVAWFAYTENILGLILPALVITGLALLTLELRKRKPQREDKVAARGKLGSKIITFSLLIVAVALAAIVIKTFVGTPPKKEKDLLEEWLEQKEKDSVVGGLKQPVRKKELSELDRVILGYSPKKLREIEASYMNVFLSDAKSHYMMLNPNRFLYVDFHYDRVGNWARAELPESVDTNGKICIHIRDNRGVFSNKSGAALLGQFKRTLESIYRTSSIAIVNVDMDVDIVAMFCSEENVPLGYFYQGEYHLWEE